MGRSFRQLIERLYPDRELKDVPDDHPIYNLHQKLNPGVRIRMIDNGIRPLIIWFTKDIGGALQANDIGRRGSFTALNNLYLYTVGLNPRRTRLQRDYIVPEQTENLPRKVQVARLKHNGAYNPEPAALPQLKALLARDHATQMNIDTIDPTELSTQRIAFLTTLGEAKLTDQQAQAIRQWLERGGTLWLDAAGGSEKAARNAQELLKQIMPKGASAPMPLSSSSPIISGKGLKDGYDNHRIEFRYFALREMGPVMTPRLQAVRINDRPAIIFSPEDITAGLAGIEDWGIFGYTIPSARHLVVNSILNTYK